MTLLAAIYSLAAPSVYDGLVQARYLPGAFSQDAVSAVVALTVLALAAVARPDRPKVGLVALGLLGFLAYAYGIYVIERVYNSLYLVYMAVFALSFWAVVYEAMALARENPRVRLPRSVRFVSAAGALLQPLMFYPLWIATLLPLMAARQKIDTTYSIFVLDLCLIMPAFLILAVDAFRGGRIGLLLPPSAFVLGFTIILPLAAVEPAKALLGLGFDPVSFWPWLALSLLFLALGVVHLLKLQVPQTPSVRDQR
ncbi:hypothetical protein SPF06_10590 [Sinomonas sp. JGH33]|uniref:Uncharacterized protein n=1 Tax=Sinomonas terricola TaxID=3110330 RepID=A0ABU5T6G6_9MICC|nr:hypothetical protein [Sinomonas sp. JGH33]MEA5455168.1 hypothetical protein [Sinomonas sp. JGH33]